MAVAFDAATVIAQTTGELTTTHTPAGTPKGAIVWVVQDAGASDEVTGATYGGSAMTEMTGSPFLSNEVTPRAVYGYFKGSSLASGAQTVTISVNGTASPKFAVVETLTATGNTEIVDTDATIDASVTNPAVTLSLGGVACYCSLAFWAAASGVGGITPFANWTGTTEQDFGARTGGAYRYDIIGTTDVTAGITHSGQATMIAVAVKDTSTASAGVSLVGGKLTHSHLLGGSLFR